MRTVFCKKHHINFKKLAVSRAGLLAIKALMLFLVLSSLSTGSLLAAEKEMVVFGYNSKPPKVWKEKDKNKGILIDMMEYAGKEMGYVFHIRLYPWARAYRSALKGNGAIIGFSKNADRLKIFDYSEVMYHDDILLVVRKDNIFPFETIDDLKDKRIAIDREGSLGDSIDRAKKTHFKVVNSDTAVMRLLHVLNGRADAAVIGPGKIGYIMTINHSQELINAKDKLVLLPTPLVRDPNYLGISKQLNKQKFISEFNRAIRKGWESGAFEGIIQRHMETTFNP